MNWDARSVAEPGVFGRGPMLLAVYDLCLAVAILCVPLMMVGIREWGVGLFVLCALVMGATWAVQQLWRPFSRARLCGAEAIVLLAIGCVLLQIAPLSSSLLAVLSPFSREFLPLWHGPQGQLVGAGPWRHISLTPELTRSGLVLLLAYSLFFLTLVHRLRTPADIDRTLKVIALSAAVVAGIGLGQLLFGNGKYLWLFDHPSRDATGVAKGPFANQNHFASFLALGIGPLLWWWQSAAAGEPRFAPTRNNWGGRVRSEADGPAVSGPGLPVGQTRPPRQTRSPRMRVLRHPPGGLRPNAAGALQNGIGVALAAVGLAIVLSFSRGGLAAAAVAFGFTALATAQHMRPVWRMTVAIAGFVLAGLIVFGAGPLAEAWNSFVSAASFREISSGRFALWGALLEAVPWFWPAGSGLGSHAEIYPIWLTLQSQFRFSHAECGYLQVLVEMGLPGLGLLLAGLALCASWCRRTWRHGDGAHRHRIGAIAAGLLAGALHSLVDFVWYVPGYMIVTLGLAACACRCAQLSRREEVPATLNRSAWVLAWTVLLAIVPVGRFCVDNLERTIAAAPHGSAYRKQTVLTAKRTNYRSTRSLDESLDELIAHLEACVRSNPYDYGAASSVAALYLRRFEVSAQSSANRMTLRQVQDTVRQAEFASAAETRDWLFRAFGDAAADLYRAREAARYGLQGQPLRGETYIVLAEVAFLEGHTAEERTALVEQAVLLRPHTPPVLYAAGSLMADMDDWDTAFDFWRRAFTYDESGQPPLIRRLAPSYTATDLIERLQPAAAGVWLLFQVYGELGQTEDRMAAARYFQNNLKRFVAEADRDDATFWDRGFQMLSAAGKPTWARHCLQEAVRAEPANRALRRKLADLLIEHQQFDAAIRELQWCHLRDPEDQQIAAALRKAQAQRSLQLADTATPSATNLSPER